jgi:hypothetical protein
MQTAVSITNKFFTDFNYREDPDTCWGDFDEAYSIWHDTLTPGHRLVFTDDFHECEAVIVEVDHANRMVGAKLDYSTWRSNRKKPITQ